MYLDIVLIDQIGIDGVLTTYRITPSNNPRDRVVIDRLSDIDRNFEIGDAMNIGGTRIYNSSSCSIQMQQAKLRQFEFSQKSNSVSFYLEHMGVPVGPGGFYNLILPPSFRFTELHVTDPYDTTQNDPSKRKSFRYNTIWDSSCSTQLVTMDLTSRRGSFSFHVLGTARIFDGKNLDEYVDADETSYSIADMLDIRVQMSYRAKSDLADKIAEKSEWLELKPNFMGIGFNLNEIAKDAISAFKKRVRREE